MTKVDRGGPNGLPPGGIGIKVNFPFYLSDVLYLYDSLHREGCFRSILMFQSSPQIQCFNHLNFGTSDLLYRFGDNRSLEQLWLLSFLFKCLSICVFEVYVERQILWVTKLSWFKLCRLLHKEYCFSLLDFGIEHIFFSEILCTSALLWQLLKYPLSIHYRLPIKTLQPHRKDNASKYWQMLLLIKW